MTSTPETSPAQRPSFGRPSLSGVSHITSISPSEEVAFLAATSSPTSADNVKVISRVRPFNRREYEIQDDMNSKLNEWEKRPLRTVVDMTPTSTLFLDYHNDYHLKEEFKFDFNFWSIPADQQTPSYNENVGTSGIGSNPTSWPFSPERVVFATQELVFEKVGTATLFNSFQGYNSCIFAYGQTGSGKTHTMMGTPADPGLIPRVCLGLFKDIQEKMTKALGAPSSSSKSLGAPVNFPVPHSPVSPPVPGMSEIHSVVWTVDACYLEIYNEHVKDLLWQLAEPSVWEQYDKANLRVRNIPGQGPFVVGLTSIPVQSWEECDNIINAGMLNRATAATKMNDTSSRSHAVFRLTLKQITTLKPQKQFERPKVLERTALINLVDLAGSERLKKTGAVGDRLKEAAAINLSLTTLKNVIDALVEQRQVIPYRDSQLTWLLSESLGGNSKTFMIACLSPHYDNADETLNTLRYALRTQGVVNHARVNESDEAKKIAALQKELADAQNVIRCGGDAAKTLLKREMDEKVAVLESLEAKAKSRKVLENQLMVNIEEETLRTYRAVYCNQFRSVLLKRLSNRLAENSVRWQEQLATMDYTLKIAVDTYTEVEKALKIAEGTEDAFRIALVRAERDKDKVTDQIQDIEKETATGETALQVIKTEKRKAWTRTWITRYMCAALKYLKHQKHLKELEAGNNYYSEKLQAVSRELMEDRANLQESHQLVINQQKAEIDIIAKQIAETAKAIEVANNERKQIMHRLTEDITFFERENRSMDDERVARMTQLETQSSKKYNMESNQLSERSVKGRQTLEQEHCARMHELQRQLFSAGEDHKKDLSKENSQWQHRLAVVEEEFDRALIELGKSCTSELDKRDAQMDDIDNYIRIWSRKHLDYDSVHRELEAFLRQRNTRDPELRTILEKMGVEMPKSADSGKNVFLFRDGTPSPMAGSMTPLSPLAAYHSGASGTANGVEEGSNTFLNEGPSFPGRPIIPGAVEASCPRNAYRSDQVPFIVINSRNRSGFMMAPVLTRGGKVSMRGRLGVHRKSSIMIENGEGEEGVLSRGLKSPTPSFTGRVGSRTPLRALWGR